MLCSEVVYYIQNAKSAHQLRCCSCLGERDTR